MSDNKVELTTDEIAVLRAVEKGADIWGVYEAKDLRSIQRKAPELIDIVPAMEKPSGEKRQPYFGCIATKAGRDYLRAIKRRRVQP